MRVVVMAQGQQTRLRHLGYPKQLLPITESGETIVDRTLRLVREQDPAAEVFVVADPILMWLDVCRKHGATLWCSEHPGNSILDGLKDIAEELLDCHAVILLGDVVFSTQTLRQTLTQDFGLVGRETENQYTKKSGEIFALVLQDGITDGIYNAVVDPEWRASIIKPNNPGRLWDLKAKLDLPLVSVAANDWTDDIDDHHDISNVWPVLRAMVRVYG